MTTKFFRCLLGGVLIAGLIAPRALAGGLGTTTISFDDEIGIGLLTDQTLSNVLTAPMGTPTTASSAKQASSISLTAVHASTRLSRMR